LRGRGSRTGASVVRFGSQWWPETTTRLTAHDRGRVNNETNMNEKTRTSYDTRPPVQRPTTLQDVCNAIERLDEKFDEFARVFLNAKFPHGKPTERWARCG
jgi:hypothetical protein